MAYCTDCGSEIRSNAEICPNCGVRQLEVPRPNTGKSRVTAALLAFFLGGLGAHKFYMGKAGQGLLYILFVWTFIPSLVAFVEFIIYLCDSDEAFAMRVA